MKETYKERKAKGNFKSKEGTNKRRTVHPGQKKVSGEQTNGKEGKTYKQELFKE